MFAGTLTQISLSEVLRLLSISSQSGALILESRDFRSSIFLQVGQIVHATAGDREGLDALTEICEHVEANFAFSEGFIAPARTLGDYPTDKLIEKIRKRVEEILAVRAAMFRPNDIPCYMPGRKVAGLVAKPDELSLLLLADGKRSVREVATLARREEQEVCQILGKFRHAGMVDLVGVAEAQEEPVAPQAAGPEVKGLRHEPNDQATEGHEWSRADDKPRGEEKPARYWRGKRLD